jgi:RNA polymerase sigma-70 factor, ECF subfamily
MQPLAQTPAGEDPVGADDRRLVSEVLGKDRKATAEFTARCADYVYPFVHRRLTPRTEVIEDLMQEILLAAWQNLQNFRGDASLRAWILGIARHKVEDYYRKRIRALELQEDEHPVAESAVLPPVDERLDAALQQQRVQKTLALLPEPYALALIWRYRDERSTREMAELTGKTEKAIERLLARARETFRQRWNDDRP